jgi:hypothetical protein
MIGIASVIITGCLKEEFGNSIKFLTSSLASQRHPVTKGFQVMQ